MKFFRGILNILVLIQFLFQGCEFRPDEILMTQINPPNEQGPPIKIRLAN